MAITMEELKRKAKAYDEALESAKEIVNNQNASSVWKDWLRNTFPELKENKGEEIRKNIISYLHNEKKVKRYISDIEFDKWIAWLEKQGEQKPIPPVWKYKKDHLPLPCDSITLNKYGGVGKSPSGALVSGLWVLDFNELAKLPKEEIEKQVPVDKIEPKFHEGDWVVLIATGSAYQVEKIENYEYTLRHISGGSVRLSKEKLIREWTIQDAKKGDVLYSPCLKLLWIFKDKSSVYCGCNLIYNNGAFSGEGYIEKPTDAIPATKKQRDLLFQKMKEAGYEWDAEKKKLRKIDARKNLTLDGDLMQADCMTVEQKPAWSEEDEHRAKDTIYFLDTAKKHYASTVELDACIDWLKSLKDKVQPQSQQEWSEEDDNMLTDAIGAVGAADYYTFDDKQEIENWLKCLKQKIVG